MTPTQLDASIVTLSYRGDFEYFRLLCQSLDKFASDHFLHRVFVPKRDLPLFSKLAGANRIITTEERNLLPRWLVKMPMPAPHIMKMLRLPRRNIYLNLHGMPVRGWIAQQIMKISASLDSPTEIILHMDSDGVFIRPLDKSMLVNEHGAVRFYRNPTPETHATHVLWREVGCRLLGIDPGSFVHGDYIGLCIIWRRSIVQRMVQRIEAVTGKNWRVALAQEPHFSEYTLYGLFVESLGVEAAGHFVVDQSQAHEMWHSELSSPQEEDDLIEGLQPHHIAFLIQSTANMPFEKRLELLQRAQVRAEAQG